MNEAKLLACPFCGRQPQLSSRGSEHTKTGWLFIVSCMCGGHSARAHMTGDSESDVRAKWNTRAGGRQPVASEPPGVSTSASANGSVLVSDVKKAAEKIMDESEAEARQWQDKGDTHGMNFYQGKRSGANCLLMEMEALNDRISDPAKRRVD